MARNENKEAEEKVEVTPDEALNKLKELEADNALLKSMVMQVIEGKIENTAPASSEKEMKVDSSEFDKAFAELVPIQLYKDNGKYNSDLFVRLNGRQYKIQRGKRVMVPKPIKEIIDQSEESDRRCAEMIDRLVADYQE